MLLEHTLQQGQQDVVHVLLELLIPILIRPHRVISVLLENTLLLVLQSVLNALGRRGITIETRRRYAKITRPSQNAPRDLRSLRERPRPTTNVLNALWVSTLMEITILPAHNALILSPPVE